MYCSIFKLHKRRITRLFPLSGKVDRRTKMATSDRHLVDTLTSLDFDVLTTTAHELQQRLSSGTITTLSIIKQYLRQIEKEDSKGAKLLAMISVAPYDILIQQATTLDEERASGKLRSPLHGLPVLVKDAIMTGPELGMDTTCGSFALKGVKVRENAAVVDSLLRAGLVIIGKTNLSVGFSLALKLYAC
jgi:amidase